MATRWKNTSEKWREINSRNRDLIMVLGVGAIAGGLFFLMMNIIYRGYYSDEASLLFFLFGNLSFGGGSVLFFNNFLNRKLGGWRPEQEDYYGEWREASRQMEKKILKAGGVGLFLACVYLLSMITERYIYMASGYLTVMTVLIQTALYLALSRRFWQKKLDFIIDHLEEQTEQRISEALEIERKSLEKVSRSDQLRVDLITNVSHDLKTPLTSMVGYIELIKKEELSDAVKDYVEVISERAEKLKEMINSLFSLAKASSGNVELHVEKFEVNRLVGQVFADLDDRIKESGLSFVQQLTDESTEVETDNMYFYRIVQNLMENALKYSAKGTRVFVKTYRKRQEQEKPERLCLEITNTAGYYMDFTKEDIVERFARGDKSRSSEGNGLGLAIVSTYAKALGGEFDIKIDCDQFKACLEFPTP